jgi:CHAP domain
MSLDTTLARIAQIETAFRAPSTIATSGAPAGTSAASSTTAPTTMGTNFATQLQSALAPQSALTAPQSALTAPQSTLTAPQPTLTAQQITDPSSAGAGQRMVQIAQSQIGQSEQPPGSNDGPAIAQYRTATAGAASGEPWCAYFASWVARQAGEPIGGQGQGLGYVGDIWSWAQQTGRAIANGSGVTPQPGDLIVFGDHHVGIVDQVLPNGSIETIEGNYDNKVSQVVRSPTEATGYVRM